MQNKPKIFVKFEERRRVPVPTGELAQRRRRNDKKDPPHQRSWHDDENDKKIKQWKSKNKRIITGDDNGLIVSNSDLRNDLEYTDTALLKQRNYRHDFDNTYYDSEVSEDGGLSLNGLSDEEILAKLPSSTQNLGHAKALSQCNYAEGCTRVASAQGLCTEHFCELYRRGEIHIQETYPDKHTEHPTRTPSHRRTERTPSPDPWKPSVGDYDYSRRDRKEQKLGYGERRPLEELTSTNAKTRRDEPTRGKCAGPMCTKVPTAGDVCESCARKFSATRMPPTRKSQHKSKWHCANQNCDQPTNNKRGLCPRCQNILMDVNASNVPMPKPDVLPAKRHARQSPTTHHRSRDGRRDASHRGQEMERNMDRTAQARGGAKRREIEYTERRHDYREPDTYARPRPYEDDMLPPVLRPSTHRPAKTPRDRSGYDDPVPQQRHQLPIYDNPHPYRYHDDPLEPAQGFEILDPSGPTSSISDVTTSSATDDDYSLCSYVSKARPGKCQATGCDNYGNASCAGFCNACYKRFA